MANRYFLNIGTNYGDTANWSDTDGGTGGFSVPTSTDDVFFTANSGNCSIITATRNARHVVTTGYTNTITNSYVWDIYGNVTLSSTTTITGTGQFRLVGSFAHNITQNSATFSCTLVIINVSRTITLLDNWTIQNYIAIGQTTGSYTINGYSMTTTTSLYFTGTTGSIFGTTVFRMTGSGLLSIAQISGRIYSPIEIETDGTINNNTGFAISNNYNSISAGNITVIKGNIVGTFETESPPVRGSLNFNGYGATKYVNIDNLITPLANTTTGTWSCWVKLKDWTPSTSNVFISFGDTNLNSYIGFWNVSGKTRAGQVINNVTKWILEQSTAINDATGWLHLAIVQDGTSPVLYVNGVAVAQTFTTSTDKTTWFNSDVNLDNGRIGCYNVNSAGNTLYTQGEIGSITIFDTNLSAAEVLQLYNSGQEIIPVQNMPQYANIVAHYPILNSVYPTITDVVGGYNGTMTNMSDTDIIQINRTITSIS